MAKQTETQATRNAEAETQAQAPETVATPSQPEAPKANGAGPVVETEAEAPKANGNGNQTTADITSAAKQAETLAEAMRKAKAEADAKFAELRAQMAKAEAEAKAEADKLAEQQKQAEAEAARQKQLAQLVTTVAEVPKRISAIAHEIGELAEADAELADLQKQVAEAATERNKLASLIGNAVATLQAEMSQLKGVVPPDSEAATIINAAAPDMLEMLAQCQRFNVVVAKAATQGKPGETPATGTRRRAGRGTQREAVRDLLVNAGPNGMSLVALHEAIGKAVEITTVRTYISDLGNKKYAGERGPIDIKMSGDNFVYVGPKVD